MAWWMTASGWVLAAEKNDDFPLPGGNAAEARALTAQMLAAGDGDVVAWRAACETLRALVEPESPLGEKLSAALADSAAGSDAYRAVLNEVGRALDFVPLAEAPLPEGFPTYTPVGVIEAKQYPARRLAKAEGFWTLFRHITANDIAMTAPVQMEYEADDRGRVQQRSMAFYYGSGNLGAPGKQGSVSVIDDQPQWVATVGVRGFSTRNSIAAAKAQLEAWLARHPEYEADGMLRVMGYNSPMVRGDRQFHEVQLPIRKRTASS
jgi:hypothetical protein